MTFKSHIKINETKSIHASISPSCSQLCKKTLLKTTTTSPKENKTSDVPKMPRAGLCQHSSHCLLPRIHTGFNNHKWFLFPEVNRRSFAQVGMELKYFLRLVLTPALS